MKNIKIVTIVIALYGALLSTYLAIRQVIKDRRLVRVYFEHNTASNKKKIVIVNVGERPITISSIKLDRWTSKPKPRFVTSFRSNEILDANVAQPELPKTLKDGESITFALSEIVREDHIFGNPYAPQDHIFIAYAKDTEGRLYKSDKKKIEFVPTYEYSKKEEQEGVLFK